VVFLAVYHGPRVLMKRYITTTKYFLTSLFIVGFVFFGRGAPTAHANTLIQLPSTFILGSDPRIGIGADVVYLEYDNPTFNYHNFTSNTGTDQRVHGHIYIYSGNFGDTSTLVHDNGDYGSPGTQIDLTTIAVASNGFYNAFTGPAGNYWVWFQRNNDYTTTDYGFAFTRVTTNGAISGVTPETCSDGIENQDETGIDLGGVCATLTINTPVDSAETQDFQNFSVSYTKVGVPDQNHQVLVQWSDDSSLLTTCENGVAGSLYTGSFVAGSSYSVCTNSLPRIYIDLNTISFSAGITSYTGSVPKSHSLTNGKTYYAQAFIVGDDGFYYTASSVISFTASGGVPVVTGNGTITNSAGSGTITGTGTHFTSTLHIGDTLTVGGQQCKVLSIASDTELECTPLTSAHTTASYTQNSNFDSSVLQETCSTWDFGCYIKNTISWFFGVSDTTLQNFGTLSLRDRFPFSYISDVGTLFGETFDQSADSFSLDIDLLGNSFTVLSTAQLEAIPFQSLVRTIMGAMAMFFTVMFIYRKIIRVHDANHKTA